MIIISLPSGIVLPGNRFNHLACCVPVQSTASRTATIHYRDGHCCAPSCYITRHPTVVPGVIGTEFIVLNPAVVHRRRKARPGLSRTLQSIVAEVGDVDKVRVISLQNYRSHPPTHTCTHTHTIIDFKLVCVCAHLTLYDFLQTRCDYLN